MSTITRERAELKSFITGFLSDPMHDDQSAKSMTAEVFRIALASLEAVPSPELLCQFVMQNYANYQGAWLCGKSSEILSFLLLMAGHECEKVACTINGVGHLYVRSGDLILDPSIAQFGDYPEISRGKHPCTGMGYVENSTEPQKYRNANSDSEIIRAMKIAPASLEAEADAVCQHQWKFGGANKLQGQKQCLKCGRVELVAPPAPAAPDLKELEAILDWILMLPCPTPKATHFAKRLAVVIDACRAAMLQELQKSAGVSNNCRSNENVQDLQAGNSLVIPDGWKLVPVEPTANQWAAGMQAFDSGVDKVTRVYKAMLAAAPQQEVK
ncbi:hypothetical protein ACJVTN_14150 [Enterobacter hormaechei subsp. xiangfangensis]|nr:hypothetical protein [Enterobacter hormaechei]